jgi:hypothetical protein
MSDEGKELHKKVILAEDTKALRPTNSGAPMPNVKPPKPSADNSAKPKDPPKKQ